MTPGKTRHKCESRIFDQKCSEIHAQMLQKVIRSACIISN